MLAQSRQQADLAEETARAGLLEQQASWLHQLVVSLDAEERLQLFQTCMQLATQVVASAPSVMLKLQETPSNTLEGRRKNIAKILCTKRSFGLAVQADGPLPFPTILSSQVTRLCMNYGCQLQISSWLKLEPLAQLRSLSLGRLTTEPVLMQLSVALEAGHLQQLDDLSHDDSLGRISHECYERFARALGARVKTLHVHGYHLLRYLQHLSALQMLVLDILVLYAATCSRLSKHPTLQTVNLVREGCYLHGCGSKHPCSWSKLHVTGLCDPKGLSTLPLDGFQELYIQNSIYLESYTGVQAFHTVIERLLSRIHLVSQYDTFYSKHCFVFWNLTTNTLPIVSRLPADCWLILNFSIRAVLSPTFMPALWAALSPTCHSVGLLDIGGVSWPTFWHGIPGHVRHVEVSSEEFNVRVSRGASDLANAGDHAISRLVASVPVHVESLRFCDLSGTVIDSLETAGVRQAAPEHLKLELSNYSV